MQNIFVPKNWDKLTPKQKGSVLESFIFVEQKKSGADKARLVINGAQQRVRYIVLRHLRYSRFYKVKVYSITFNPKFVNPPFSAVSLFRFHMTQTYCIEPVLTKDFSESRTLIVSQNLNVMAPELPLQQSLLSVERHTNLSLVKPKSS